MNYLSLTALAHDADNSDVDFLSLTDSEDNYYFYKYIENGRLHFEDKQGVKVFSIHLDDADLRLNASGNCIVPFNIIDTNIEIKSVFMIKQVA